MNKIETIFYNIFKSSFWKDAENVPYSIYGDTDSIYTVLKMGEDKNIVPIDKIISFGNNYAVELNETVNKIYDEVLCSKFNIDPQYNLMNFKNEKIMTRFLQLAAKKAYGVAKIFDEGRIYSPAKVDYTGGQIVKVTPAKISNELLKEIYEYILTTENITEDMVSDFIYRVSINKYTRKLKDNINKWNIPYIGTSVRWGVRQYDENRVNKAIAGCKLFNTFIADIFRPGARCFQTFINFDTIKMKSKIVELERTVGNKFFLDSKTLEKLDTICVPTDFTLEKYKDKLEKFIDEYNVSISWDRNYNTNIDNIIDPFRAILPYEEVDKKKLRGRK